MADSEPTFGLLVPAQISTIQILFASMTVHGLLMGIVLVLAVMATYRLCQQGLRGSLGRQVLFIAVVIAFLASVTVFISILASDMNTMTFFGANPVPTILIIRLSVGPIIGSRINYLLSDLIVVWRAWVLAGHLVHRVILAICTLTVIGCELAEAVLTVQGLFSNPTDGKKKELDLLLFIPLLVTNVVATCVIAHKTWHYRTEVKVHLETSNRQTRVEKILLLFIESGLIYCAFWIVALVAALGPLSHLAKDVIGGFLTYTAAIYPMIIIILVSRGENTSSGATGAKVPTQSIHFAPSPHTTQSIIQSLTYHENEKKQEISIDSPP